MASEFVAIKMIGLDDRASRPVHAGAAMFRMVILLSAQAPSEWAQYFNGQWKQHIYMMKRKVIVSRNTLVIECVPDELENDQMQELRAILDKTNSAYSEFMARKQQVLAAEEARKAEAAAKMTALKNKIKFD